MREVPWVGRLALAIGTLAADEEMRAHFCVVVEFRDGRIWRQRNYDCFEPFRARGRSVAADRARQLATRSSDLMTEWFRRTTWTDDDERDFFARLARSRGPERKAQYLRIQASHLAAATPPLHGPALRLLEQLLADYPDDAMLAQVHARRGASLAALGRTDDAVAALRAALAAQRARPNVRTSAYLDFAWLVATRDDDLAPLRDEALAALAEFGADGEEAFPAGRYRRDAARAMLLAASGDRAAAAVAARSALAAAAATHSGFRYHPTLGLVESPDAAAHARVVRLAVS